MGDSDSHVTTAPSRSRLNEANADVEWDSFNSDKYFEHNYGELHEQDARIIEIVADHFQRTAPARDQWRERAIDVGSGANLYPALTMLPFASEVVLYERAFTNREWLQHQLKHPASSWQSEFWPKISDGRRDYGQINEPVDLLSHRAQVVKGNVFNLRPDEYQMGTMFFVAESITNRNDEFERAAKLFVNTLVSRAPFAAAFMRDSSGYIVDGQRFPACSIDENDVARCLSDVAAIDKIQVIPGSDLREGYQGMIVATGRKR